MTRSADETPVDGSVNVHDLDVPAPTTGQGKVLDTGLLRAIVEPDIYTSRTDRDRAVGLRWILRDIKGNRLKWSPIRPHDLQVLIELELSKK
jgi:hypothetical protein